MDENAAFGFRELFRSVIGDMAKALCERKGETKSQQYARSRAATYMIMGFLPRDVIEAVLAGHCVMFHTLMTDSVGDTLRGELDTMRRATRSSIVAMDRAFASNLRMLERYQNRPAQGRRDAPEAAVPETAAASVVAHAVPAAARRETAGAAPVERAVPVDARPETAAASVVAHGVPADVRRETAGAAPVECAMPVNARRETASERAMPADARRETAGAAPVECAMPADARPEAAMAEAAERVNGVSRSVLDSLPRHLRDAMALYTPAPETIAACLANPEAMAALEEGDPARFAIAMGVDMPSEEYMLAATMPGGPFDRSTPAGGNPKARR